MPSCRTRCLLHSAIVWKPRKRLGKCQSFPPSTLCYSSTTFHEEIKGEIKGPGLLNLHLGHIHMCASFVAAGPRELRGQQSSDNLRAKRCCILLHFLPGLIVITWGSELSASV